MIYLTATPDIKYRKRIQKKQLSVSYLPLRFHQHLLPEIKFVVDSKLIENLKRGIFSQRIQKILIRWGKQKTPFLIFVPQINYLEPVLKIIRKIIPQIKGASVYANDSDRIDKVNKLRRLDYYYLVTTTILERGVTFKNLDLMVLGADDNNFSCSSLVQIAGRVGRSKTKPDGDVYFIIRHYNLRIKNAQKQIKKLNHKAKVLLQNNE